MRPMRRRGSRAGFVKYLRYDLVAGFLVFLIALPLLSGRCQNLRLSASGRYPDGRHRLDCGGVSQQFGTDHQRPGGGLDPGRDAGCDVFWSHRWSASGCRSAGLPHGGFAVGVAAGVIQVLFGVLRAGKLGDFFSDHSRARDARCNRHHHYDQAVPLTFGGTNEGEPWNC